MSLELFWDVPSDGGGMIKLRRFLEDEKRPPPCISVEAAER
jgi:hypothetical protein